MWARKRSKRPIQLDADAGVSLAGLLADAFRIRFARGFGADAVATILADAPVGATSAGASAVTQTDLLELIKSVDPAYASADSAGWAMSWNTLVYIFENVITTSSAGDAMYHAKKDDRGHYLLFGMPVYISPSLSDLGASNKSVFLATGTNSSFRNVPNEARVLRFDELFMRTHELGYEMLFRADSKIIHSGGSGDDPIKVLACHG